MMVSDGHDQARREEVGGGPSELRFRWIENMRMHFAVMCDRSAATLKT